MDATDTIYDPLMNKEFLIDYIKQINQEITLFTAMYYESQFDQSKADFRKITFENIKIITEQKKQFIKQLKSEFNYAPKD